MLCKNSYLSVADTAPQYMHSPHSKSHKTPFVRDPAPLCQGREMVPVTDHHVCTASQYMQYQTGRLGSCPPCLNAC